VEHPEYPLAGGFIGIIVEAGDDVSAQSAVDLADGGEDLAGRALLPTLDAQQRRAEGGAHPAFRLSVKLSAGKSRR
jgi:hypothetical protein